VRLLPLVLILLLGLGLRSLYFTTPLADAHRWRQTDNATVAFNLAFDRFNIFQPQVNWGGPGDAAVEMEFPVLPALVAVFHRLFGDSHLWGRATVIGFSLGTIVLIYCIARRLFGEPEARGAAFLFAISPAAVYFGRAFIVDTPTVFLSAAAILAFLTYVDEDNRPAAAIGVLCLALAWMAKLPALLTLGPVAYIGLRSRGFGVFRDPWFVGGIAFALVMTAAWYWHANNIYLRTGLTVGIWRGAGTYPPALAPLTGPTSTFTGWSTWEMLSGREFYETLLERFWTLHLTPIGSVLSVAGIVLATGRGRADIALVWLAAALSFVIVVGQGNLNHEYYQLPVLPPLALFFGIAAAPVFGEHAWRSIIASTVLRRAVVAVVASAVLGLALLGFHESNIIRDFFRPDRLDMVPVEVGEIVRASTPPDASFVVVEHADTVNAANSPMLLYHARRRGWTFDLVSLTPAVTEALARRGADYFLTTVWSDLEERQPEVAKMLAEQEEVPLEQAPHDTRMFRLTNPASPTAR